MSFSLKTTVILILKDWFSRQNLLGRFFDSLQEKHPQILLLKRTTLSCPSSKEGMGSWETLRPLFGVRDEDQRDGGPGLRSHSDLTGDPFFIVNHSGREVWGDTRSWNV